MINKKSILYIIAILLIVSGISIFMYPYASDYLYQKEVEKNEDEFKKDIKEQVNEDKLEELYQYLQLQNIELFRNKQKNLTDPFSYEQATVDLRKYGIENNIIGYIEIPKMEIKLPILLGANKQNMNNGAVHLTQTSYPIGGVNTNSVIAAHRGWAKAQMFKHIEKLEYGDEIYITNFKGKIAYRVYETKIIEPNDVKELMIEEGKDIITLITCHPYRVNTQRYVVKACH